MDFSEIKIFIKDWNDGRFAVELRGFCQHANQILKSIDGYQYNPEHKVWIFDVSQKEDIIKKLKDFDVIFN